MSNSLPLECFHFHCKLHWDLSGSECMCVLAYVNMCVHDACLVGTKQLYG